jgi:putative DNA primase/helicase
VIKMGRIASLIDVLSHVPEEMKAKKNWVPRRGKRPFGKSNDPSTWLSFDEAVSKGRGAVCFALDGDGLVALDLDDCIDDGGKLHPNARKIINLCPSYTEISLSGHGLHVFGFAKLPFAGRKKGVIEIYGANRFIAVTGNTFEDRHELKCIQAGIDILIRRFFTERKQPVMPRPRMTSNLDDRALLDRITQSPQGDKFMRLWKGDISGYPSHSEADMALCRILAFWTGGDRARIDALFRQSGLMRAKWDRRLRPGYTYGSWTIERVCHDW